MVGSKSYKSALTIANFVGLSFCGRTTNVLSTVSRYFIVWGRGPRLAMDYSLSYYLLVALSLR